LEQLILILAVLAALSGFGMGLINLAGPYLKRRKIALPGITLPQFNLARLLRRGGVAEEDDDFDLEDEDDISAARDFAENSFAATSSLLTNRRAIIDDDEELDEELAGVLDQVAEEELVIEDETETEEDGPAIYTVAAQADVRGEPSEESPNAFDDAGDEEDGDEYEEEDEEETTAPEIQVIAAGGDSGNDMLSFFGESADDVAKVVQPWREDLPEVTIEELLADARAIRQQISGNKPNAA